MSANRILQKTRLEALTDGIYAVAMTIMALSLVVPQQIAESELSQVLLHYTLQDLLFFLGSFIILGTQWVAVNFQHGFLLYVDRTYCWLTLAILALACIVPFSATLLMRFPHERIVIDIYACNLLLSQLFQWFTLEYSMRNKLNKEDVSFWYKLVLKRIFLTPFFYVSGIIVAHWSINIAFILLIVPPIFYIFPSALDKYTKAD